MLEDTRPIRLSLEPLDDYVVVEPTDEEAETRAGLILPASAEAQCRSGIVTAVGSEVEGIVPGDKVLFPSDAGYESGSPAPRRRCCAASSCSPASTTETDMSGTCVPDMSASGEGGI